MHLCNVTYLAEGSSSDQGAATRLETSLQTGKSFHRLSLIFHFIYPLYRTYDKTEVKRQSFIYPEMKRTLISVFDLNVVFGFVLASKLPSLANL